jgi:beta-xylosidase
VRRGGSYLLFYAGGHCCRPPCTYAEGVARSASLLGPYVKDPANPLLVGNAAWQCPGHGTTIDLGAGGLYLLHHAYRADDAFDRRRSTLLDRVDFTPDGWPTIARRAGARAHRRRSAGQRRHPGATRVHRPLRRPAPWRPAGSGRSSPPPMRDSTAEACA